MGNTQRKQQIRGFKREAKAVLISDVHYRANNLSLVHTAMTTALRKAEELKVPLIDAGDLMDEKAVIRAECANALIDLFKDAKTRVVLLVGNHTKINVKGDEHALNFLRPYCDIIQAPVYDNALDIHFIPYCDNSSDVRGALENIRAGSTVITHNGLLGADMGHYVKDTSSLPPEAFSHLRTISGHYHKKQDIDCGPGTFSYLGSPVTHTFGEANDGPKGYSILYSDGSLELVPLNLRKHIVLECSTFSISDLPKQRPDDLVWLKVTGPQSELDALDKEAIGQRLLGHSNFKLEKIVLESEKTQVAEGKKVLTGAELFDTLISELSEPEERKNYLKSLWREVV